MKIDQQAWDAIAELKPKLRSHVKFYQHVYRNQTWHIVADTLSNAHFRCPDDVFKFIEYLDGESSIAQAYQVCVELKGDDAPQQADIIQVIATLQMKELLQGDIPVSAQDLFLRYQTQKSQKKKQIWSRPLAFKMSLWDPDQWLEKITPLFSGIFNRWVLVLCMCFMAFGSSIAFVNWQALMLHFSIRFMSPENLILIWLLYPLVKLIHELGHAILTKYWGGEVHDMGVLFIVFMPVPYVDASSSYQFANKHQRMMVAAAGIFVELLLAAIGILCWSMMDDGIVRDIAFNIAVVGGLSTLFVNGNPLLRFDGYHVFCDAIEVPNLGSRSIKYLGYLCQRFLLGLDDLKSPLTAQGERGWLLFYGLTAGVYRLFISFSIAFFVASHYFIVGVVLALLSLLQQIIWPTILSVKHLLILAKERTRLTRLALTSVPISLLCAFLLFYPLNWSTNIEGVAVLPESGSVRAQSAGFVIEILKENGQKVNVGEDLFKLINPELMLEQQLIKAQIVELERRKNHAFLEGPVATQIVKLEIQQAENSLLDIQKQIAQLSVKSATSGIMSIPKALDMPGRYYHKGDVLAYVVDLSTVTVKAIIPQSKFDRLNLADKQWQGKIASQPEKTFKVVAGREVPRASYKLPSAKLGSAGGGEIRVDARDSEGRTVLEAVYQVELTITNYNQHYLAGKVAVKVPHQPESFAKYMHRILMLFLSENFQY
jgi:putative peptide zinc metalloprotease protein